LKLDVQMIKQVIILHILNGNTHLRLSQSLSFHQYLLFSLVLSSFLLLSFIQTLKSHQKLSLLLLNSSCLIPLNLLMLFLWCDGPLNALHILGALLFFQPGEVIQMGKVSFISLTQTLQFILGLEELFH